MANNSSRDISSLAESLRQQVLANQNAKSGPSFRKNSGKFEQESSELHGNVLALLDLIEHQTSTEQPVSTPSADGPWPWIDALDGTLARWQAQVTNAYAEGAARELADQLKLAELLSQSLEEREERLEEQRQRLEQRTAQVLCQEARYERQRKSVGQGLRARRAEMLLELENRRNEIRCEIRNEVGEQLRAEARDELREEVIAEVREHLRGEVRGEVREEVAQRVRDELREEIHEELREQVRSEVSQEVRQEIGDEVRDTARQEIREELREELRDEIREELASEIREQLQEEVRDDLEQEIRAKVRDELTDEISTELRLEIAQEFDGKEPSGDELAQIQMLETQLKEARAELTLVFSELERVQAAHDEAVEHANEAQGMEQELQRLRERAESADSLQTELEEVRQLLSELESQQADARDTADSSLREDFEEQLQRVQHELENFKQEAQDLKEQNSDLAAQLARHQVLSSGSAPHVSFDQQSLSWEERKKLIMQQLEDESGETEPSEEVVAKHLNIERVLETTQREIEQRDREIQELQGIIEQQSDTRQGVAIGAAAFAQAFDADEMIQEERQKLKEIQKEWEEKLRQAEIDVSMERAKLARERLQLEAELEKHKQDHPPVEVDQSQPKKRKWLEHLGLKDEGRS